MTRRQFYKKFEEAVQKFGVLEEDYKCGRVLRLGNYSSVRHCPLSAVIELVSGKPCGTQWAVVQQRGRAIGLEEDFLRTLIVVSDLTEGPPKVVFAEEGILSFWNRSVREALMRRMGLS